MAITHGTRYGGGQLARIYDRLRKRSQRAENWFIFGVSVSTRDRVRDSQGLRWNRYDHAAYVAGVKDALNAIEDIAIDGLYDERAELFLLGLNAA